MAVSAQVLFASLRHLPLPIRQNPYKTEGCCLPAGAMTVFRRPFHLSNKEAASWWWDTCYKTSELHWKFMSPLSHFMSHTLTPAQRDTMVMDKGEIVQAVEACWKRSHVMNVTLLSVPSLSIQWKLQRQFALSKLKTNAQVMEKDISCK